MTWQYLTIALATGSTAEEINRALLAQGVNGWELVSIYSTNGLGGLTSYIFATFKKPLG
jgi:hypothetical protein